MSGRSYQDGLYPSVPPETRAPPTAPRVVYSGDEDEPLLGQKSKRTFSTSPRALLCLFAGILVSSPMVIYFAVKLYTKTTDPYCAAWSAMNSQLQKACSLDGTNCGNRGNILVNRTDVIVSNLPVIVTIDLKLPDDFLPNLDGQNKLALVFARAIGRGGADPIDNSFQAAVVSLSSLYQQLKFLQRPYGLIKEKFPLELFFESYPVTIEVLFAFGSIAEFHTTSIGSQTSAFTWAGTGHLAHNFKGSSDASAKFQVTLSQEVADVEPLIRFVADRAGWSGVEFAGDGHATLPVTLFPYCNDNRYLATCSRSCHGRDDQFGHYVCSASGMKQCLPGYIRPESSCRTTNSCWNRPCLNGGTCVSAPDGPRCSCAHGFKGQFCGDAVNFCQTAEAFCRNGGTCVNFYGGYKCLCTAFFSGPHCEEHGDVCKAAMPCRNGATCKNTASGYTCHCPAGFMGKNCDQDIDECTQPVPFCKNGGTCVNTYGSAKCLCRPYTSGPRCGTKEQPPKGRVTCAVKPCFNEGTCVPLAYDGFLCQCPDGFMGFLCQFRTGGAGAAEPKVLVVTGTVLFLLISRLGMWE